MTVARTARRRRKQMQQGFTHLAKLGRPVYRRRALLNIHSAIEMERRKAQRAAAAKKRK